MNDPVRLLLSTSFLPPPPYRRWLERKLFGFSVKFVFYAACIACTVLNILQVLLAIAAYFYPNWFRRTPLYRQILQKTDRHLFNAYYALSLLAWTLLFIVHILSIGFSILGVQLRRPPLFLPQLIILLIVVLIFLGIFAISTTISVVSDDTMLVVCILSLVFLLLYGIFLTISVMAFHNVLAEYEEIRRILAKSKSVHFKEKKRKKRSEIR